MLLSLLPVLAACGKYDYSKHVSDERSDLFIAQTEEFTLTVACVDREYPFNADGVASTRTKTVEVVLAEAELSGAEYEVYFLEDVPRGGDMSFRSVTGDYFYSRGTERFPEESISLRVVKDGQPQDILATTVKNEHTLTTIEALEKATAAEQESLTRMTVDGVFRGEIHVRLLRRDTNYYYVGFVNEKGGTIALLLDGETGEVLARRTVG